MSASSSAWSPYLVGALIGLLSMATFYFSDKPLGVSSAYARLSGLIGRRLAGARIMRLKLYQDTEPKLEWETMLMFGVVLGAFLAAWSGGELTGTAIPPLWDETFGSALVPRLLAAFIGGAIMVFGARMAGGCTSGHGISGTLQLSVGSWIAVICFFVGGAAVALPLFGR